MKIKHIDHLPLPGLLTVTYERFADQRGYFTEPFRRSDFVSANGLAAIADKLFPQANESFSRKSVVRGLHFQWNPYMGKLVRTVRGHMIDLVLDIRKGSQTCGQIIAHDMPSRENAKEGQWIYVPPGFAHGNFFPEDTIIEYFCTGEYSQGCEAGISPLDPELDWGKCPPALRETVQDALRGGNIIISEKDKNGLRLRDWMDDARSDNFVFGKC